MKIQDLAKELKTGPRDVIAILGQLSYKVKSASTKLDPGTAEKVRRYHKEQQLAAEKKDQPVEKKIIAFNESTIKIKDMIPMLDKTLTDVMKAFLEKGKLVNINSEVDRDTFIEIASILNVEIVQDLKKIENEKIALKEKVMALEEEALTGDEVLRPPVITIMGHVDHGKTMLLDTIRKSNIVSKEAGGITQHIGAYQVTINQKKLTFLDTPGHEAFTALRARGAQVTDIAILVVAADEGLKPQTIEALNHAQAAAVPIIVALNKVDKPDIDIDRCKQQLSEHNLLTEDWGGKTVMVPLSAKTGKGVDDLLEIIAIQAELLELKASKSGFAKGIIIEAQLSKQKGPVATVLIKAGTLKIGDFVTVGKVYGKIRALFNDLGAAIQQVGPGSPAEILGLSEVPEPGEILISRGTEKECKEFCEIKKQEEIQNKERQVSLSMESLSSKIQGGELNQLNLIIKGDVMGSVEALKASISQIDSKDIPIQILHAATGTITENDITLAQASSGLVIGFGVQPNTEAEKQAEQHGIKIKTYNIIYEVLADIEKVVKGMYKPEFEEVDLAQIEVRQLFSFSKIGTIAGCYVTNGKVTRSNMVKVIRAKKEVFRGKLSSLKRFKEDVKEVSSGFECGIVIEKYEELKEGDMIIAFELKEKKS